MNKFMAFGFCVFLAVSDCAAGVYYYSGVQNIDIPAAGGLSWSPIVSPDAGFGAIAFSTANSSGSVTTIENSSSSPYTASISATAASGGRLKTVTGTIGASTYTYTSNQTIIYGDLNNRPDGHSPTGTNYFGWTVSSSTLDYIGWAKYEWIPDPSTNSVGDVFRIVDWAYNLGASGAGVIQVGDIDTSGSNRSNSPTVPEPASIAFLTSVLAVGFSRRRR